MQNAECRIKNFTYYKYVESDFKQMRARHTRNPLAQFTKRK